MQHQTEENYVLLTQSWPSMATRNKVVSFPDTECAPSVWERDYEYG